MYAHRMGCAPPYAVINGRMPMVRMGEGTTEPSTMEKFTNWLESPSLVQHVSQTSQVKNKTVVGVALAAGVLWYGHKHRWF